MSRLVVSALAVGLLQVGVLFWMINARASILRNGTEVVLKVEPIDPRDLFRGDYVRLGYAISTVRSEEIADREAEGERTETGLVTPAGPITVRVAPGADGFAEVVTAYLGTPPTPPTGTQVDIAGTIPGGWSLAPGQTVNVSYGIDRYYVPEGEGRRIESALGQSIFSVVAAVDDEGTAQIKSLRERDQALYEEPLF